MTRPLKLLHMADVHLDEGGTGSIIVVELSEVRGVSYRRIPVAVPVRA